MVAAAPAGDPTAHGDYTGLTTGDDHPQYVLESTLSAKGSIFAATGNATVTELGVGANGTFLIADSAAATGLKWATKL
jgi:hypothetical protein